MKTTQTMLEIIDLGRKKYKPVLELQNRFVEERKNANRPDTLVLVEHEPVYTLGRSASEGNILLAPDKLSSKGIDVVKIGRGGDVTYHGPGQIVGYPIIDLRERKLRVVDLVDGLENTITATLSHFGIESRLLRQHRGVWVGNEKIAAIGVRITRGISMHGFALNVVTDLNYYHDIVPCGITDKGVTSMANFVRDLKIDDVKKILVLNFKKEFGYGIRDKRTRNYEHDTAD